MPLWQKSLKNLQNPIFQLSIYAFDEHIFLKNLSAQQVCILMWISSDNFCKLWTSLLFNVNEEYAMCISPSKAVERCVLKLKQKNF